MSLDSCPDCEMPAANTLNSGHRPTEANVHTIGSELSRRGFMKTATVTAAAMGVSAAVPRILSAREVANPTSENLVKKLYESLSDKQKAEVCFSWDHTDDRGLLRTHVSNNWNITDEKELAVGGSFFTRDQQGMIEALFFGLYNPDWHSKIRKQLQDDAGGYGKSQTIAIFGSPATDKFEFVMTGRHLTIRCDGNSTEHMAFGGPIFYGHAASGFNEPASHEGNVYWHQAQKANGLYKMLDGKQQQKALIEKAPHEAAAGFRQKGIEIPGLPIAELSADQKTHAQEVLQALIEPYRTSDQDEVKKCLQANGGLDQCRLAFYKSGDLGDDGIWDNWRLEGPTFVWHFRGNPHVHVWVNIADNASVPLNARG